MTPNPFVNYPVCGLPRIIAALDVWRDSAGGPYTKRGWDGVMFDRIVIERVAQA